MDLTSIPILALFGLYINFSPALFCSFCSQDGSLKEDLEASEAAVLCQLPRAKPGQRWDVATLQASLNSHAAFLEEHEHLCAEELATVVHSMLDSGEEAPGSQVSSGGVGSLCDDVS